MSNYSNINNLALFSSSHSSSAQRTLVMSVVILIVKYSLSSTDLLQTLRSPFFLFLTMDISFLFWNKVFSEIYNIISSFSCWHSLWLLFLKYFQILIEPSRNHLFYCSNFYQVFFLFLLFFYNSYYFYLFFNC